MGQITDINNPYAYTGRELDDTDLYYYRARYYDPTTQRFLSQDPIGFASGDFNFYRYVGNSPLNNIDPFGKSGFDFDFSPLTGMPMDIDFAFFDWLKGYTKGLYGGAATASAVGGMCMVAPEAFYFGMRNPAMIENGLNFIESYLPGVPGMTPYGIAGAADNNAFGPNWTGE